MLKSRFFIKAIIFLFTLLPFFLGSCDNLGIFAVIALTGKTETGALPEGVSARPVVQVDNVSTDYAFFASGPGLWAKNISIPEDDPFSIWLPIPLTDGTKSWDGIQAMAASDTDIFLAFYKVESDIYTVSLHRLVSYDGTTAVFSALTGDSIWESTPTHYQQIKLFCPNGTGNVYVNVMEHDGEYGSLDESGQKFTGSKLYVIANNATSLNTATDGITDQDELDSTNASRYVTGIADNTTGKVRITATDNMFASGPSDSIDAGILLDENGSVISLGSTVSTTGITWMPNVGVFIASATALGGDTFPIFASATGDAGDWYPITNGTTTDYLTINFFDVSATVAGSSPVGTKNLILAGTSSYIDGSTGRIASGYQEIDATDGAGSINTWTVNTSADTYEFANNSFYIASDLGRGTITGMSMIGDDLYASTRSLGVWRIDTTEEYPEWKRE